MWKTGDVGTLQIRARSVDPNICLGVYHAVHMKVSKFRGKASGHPCCRCGKQADEWAYNHKDPGEKHEMILGYLIAFSPDIRNYDPMCRSCHRRIDKGLEPAS